MFGRQRRKHTEALEELREEFSAADRNGRAVLTDAMAQIELRMVREREAQEAVRASNENAIERAQSMLNSQAMDVAQLLQQVATMCQVVVERVEADRLERTAFTEALTRLVQAAPAPTPIDVGEHPLGGTVFEAPEIVTLPPAEAEAEAPVQEETIDLRDPEEPEPERIGRTLPRWVSKQS
jgi:hypothetical protein